MKKAGAEDKRIVIMSVATLVVITAAWVICAL